MTSARDRLAATFKMREDRLDALSIKFAATRQMREDHINALSINVKTQFKKFDDIHMKFDRMTDRLQTIIRFLEFRKKKDAAATALFCCYRRYQLERYHFRPHRSARRIQQWYRRRKISLRLESVLRRLTTIDRYLFDGHDHLDCHDSSLEGHVMKYNNDLSDLQGFREWLEMHCRALRCVHTYWPISLPCVDSIERVNAFWPMCGQSIDSMERYTDVCELKYKKLLHTQAMIQKLAASALTCPLRDRGHVLSPKTRRSNRPNRRKRPTKQRNQSPSRFRTTSKPSTTNPSESHLLRIFKPHRIHTIAATIISSWYRGTSFRLHHRGSVLGITTSGRVPGLSNSRSVLSKDITDLHSKPATSSPSPSKPNRRRSHRKRPPPGVRKQLQATNCHTPPIATIPSIEGSPPTSESRDKFRNEFLQPDVREGIHISLTTNTSLDNNTQAELVPPLCSTLSVTADLSTISLVSDDQSSRATVIEDSPSSCSTLTANTSSSQFIKSGANTSLNTLTSSSMVNNSLQSCLVEGNRTRRIPSDSSDFG